MTTTIKPLLLTPLQNDAVRMAVFNRITYLTLKRDKMRLSAQSRFFAESFDLEIDRLWKVHDLLLASVTVTPDPPVACSCSEKKNLFV